MAWAFQVAKRKDEFGREIEVPEHDYTSLLISRPKPFGFELSARNESREAAVRENWRGIREGREREQRGEDGEKGAVAEWRGQFGEEK